MYIIIIDVLYRLHLSETLTTVHEVDAAWYYNMRAPPLNCARPVHHRCNNNRNLYI